MQRSVLVCSKSCTDTFVCDISAAKSTPVSNVIVVRRTHYVDSGSNVDNDWEEQNVFEHLAGVDGAKAERARELLDTLKFTEVMRKGAIAELSGGWQMKLRLLKAVLEEVRARRICSHLEHCF